MTDGATFTKLKDECEKMVVNDQPNTAETTSGEIDIVFNAETRAYLEEMKKFIPEVEPLYKQITRQGKAVQLHQT